jgi:hypothetical protein
MRGLVPLVTHVSEAPHSTPSQPATTTQACCLALVPAMAPAVAAAPETGPAVKGYKMTTSKALKFKLTKMLETEHSVPSRPAATAQAGCLALVPTMAPALAAAAGGTGSEDGGGGPALQDRVKWLMLVGHCLLPLTLLPHCLPCLFGQGWNKAQVVCYSYSFCWLEAMAFTWLLALGGMKPHCWKDEPGLPPRGDAGRCLPGLASSPRGGEAKPPRGGFPQGGVGSRGWAGFREKSALVEVLTEKRW